MNPYETDELLGQYMAFHYGDSHFGVGNYPARCAGVCQELMAGRDKRSALDLGCAVGRTTFEVARVFEQVTGVDLSRRFIETADELRLTGEREYFQPDEGELGTICRVSLAEAGLANAAERVRFEVADACNLGAEHRDYDLIFAGNLIDRLQDPRSFLSSIHQHLAENGILVISSPYTLLETYTPRTAWLGGFQRNGEPFTVLDGMKEILGERFELIREPMDVPFVIRETRRKFQHSLAELTAWQRVR